MLAARQNIVAPAAPSTPTVAVTAPTFGVLVATPAGVAPAGWKSWEIQIADASGGPWTTLETAWPANQAYTYGGSLADNLTKWFRVRGTTNADQVSAYSTAVSGTTLVNSASVIWRGDFSTGNFKQWHTDTDANAVTFWQIPEYGRPIQWGGQLDGHVGDGSLLTLVTNPTRGAAYSAKFTVKNSANGSEPADADFPFPTIWRRRTELTVQQTLPYFYNAIPYQTERWASVSMFVPAGWDNGGTGFGPLLFQIKPLNEGPTGSGACFAIGLDRGQYWRVYHVWSPTVDNHGGLPWQYEFFYTGDYEGGGPYPRSDFWPDGLADYPNVAASQAALASVLKGGWTDWVINFNFDARTAAAGGVGFLKLWKREGSGPWVQVLYIQPRTTDRGGMVFAHGVGFNAPAGATPGGFGIKTGLYMDKNQVWDLSANREAYIGNVKVANASATFGVLSHDGSVP